MADKKSPGCVVKLLVLINSLFVFALIFASLVHFIPPDKMAFPALLGLPYIYIVLSNLLFVVTWLFIKKRYALLSLLPLLLFLGMIQRHFRFSSDQASSDGESIKILTYNTKNSNNNEAFFNFIRTENPDILFLQEIPSEDKNGQNILEELSKRTELPRYHYQKYYGNSYGRNANSMATFTHYPIIRRKSIMDKNRRIGLFTDMLIDGDTIRAFNVHLQSIHFGANDIDLVNRISANNLSSLDSTAKSKVGRIFGKLKEAFSKRAAQSRQIRELIAQSPYPVIVGGDFNDTPASYAYAQVSKNLNDSYCQSGSGSGKTYKGMLPALRIDYILFCDKWHASNHQVHKTGKSDHYPVSTELITNE